MIRAFLEKVAECFPVTIWISVLLVLSISLILSTNVFIGYILKLDILNDKFLITSVTPGKVGYPGSANPAWIIPSLYYFALAKKRRWKLISAGGTLQTILCIITTIVFFVLCKQLWFL